MSSIVYLHRRPARVARFLRVTEHRRLEQLLAAERLPYERFVVEAGWYNDQAELAKAPKRKGHELVLETNVAELSAIAKFSGRARHAPSANPKSTLSDADLQAGSDEGITSRLARLAENAKRLDRMRDVRGNLERTSASAARSPNLPAKLNNRELRRDGRLS